MKIQEKTTKMFEGGHQRPPSLKGAMTVKW